MLIIFLNLSNKSKLIENKKYKPITYSTNNIIDNYTLTPNKTIVSKLRDYSKAAHIRKRNTDLIRHDKIVLKNTTLPEYTIYKKPITEGIYSASNLMTINITESKELNDNILIENSKCMIKELDNKEDIKPSKYVYEKAFSDDSSTE